MRIECPTCQTAYEVPDQKVAGKKMRCANCATDWAPFAPPSPMVPVVPAPSPVPSPAFSPAFSPAPGPAPSPTPSTAPAAAPAFLAASPHGLAARPITAKPARGPTPRRGLLIAAWIATVVLVAAVIAVAAIRRESVMVAWPPSQRLYAWVGLH